jgi:SAM-dependent methyltransferase
MSSSPFIERLREHAAREHVVPYRLRDEDVSLQPAGFLAGVQRGQLAFWQSPIARASINRRITGDPQVAPETHLARQHGPSVPAPLAVSLRASNAKLEVDLLEAGQCERVIGLHEDRERVDYANSKVPEPLRGQIRFEQGDFAKWEAREPVGAVVARSVLHRYADLDGALDRVHSILAPGGLVFVDEYVGPARSQWSDTQLDIINRLLARLPDELLVELTATDGRLKRSVGRPDAERWAEANPTEMVSSGRIVPGLDERFERVEVSLYGGAIFHQLFSRIMGNFASRPELVDLLMEVDALLTDGGMVASDYVWGVWRRG